MSEYKVARGLFDSWARWVDRCNLAAQRALWFPAQDSTSRLADRYGKPDDAPVEYLITPEQQQARSEALAEMDARLHADRCEQVDEFMADLQASHPKAHLCLTARHRRVVGPLRLGRRRDGKPYHEWEVAQIVLKGPDAALRFEQECRFGYRGLERKLGLGADGG